MTGNATSITFKLPRELREALEKQAANDGRSLSDYIRRHFKRLLHTHSRRVSKGGRK